LSEYNQLIAHIRKRIDLSDAEAAEMIAHFKLVKVWKRQFIVQPGFVAHHKNYVVSGAFRAYVVGDEGQDHTIQVAIEDWWITDYNSYIYQQPATMFVVALEDSVVLQTTYADEAHMKAQHHKFETFFRVMAERSLAYMQRRIISNVTLTAEERYNQFLDQFPTLAQRLPQYALASYLGMTTEYLSRLRNKRAKKS